jgi:hypothetical protein
MAQAQGSTERERESERVCVSLVRGEQLQIQILYTH